jgi:hypothetical protein
LSASVELGVPFFDANDAGVIWVVIPTEDLGGGRWRCDQVVIIEDLVQVHAGVVFTPFYLAALQSEVW